MKIIFALIVSSTLLGCSAPDSGSFELTVDNQTNIKSFSCERWHQIGDNIVKSTCFVDNVDKAEMRPVEIRAYDQQDNLIGSALIGKATIGEKVKINKAMAMTEVAEPARLTLEVVE